MQTEKEEFLFILSCIDEYLKEFFLREKAESPNESFL